MQNNCLWCHNQQITGHSGCLPGHLIFCVFYHLYHKNLPLARDAPEFAENHVDSGAIIYGLAPDRIKSVFEVPPALLKKS